MELGNIKASQEKVARRRVGRGIGSGLGKTSGRGQKGQKSRSGGGVRRGFEGGQTPLYRRLPRQRRQNARRQSVNIRKFDVAMATSNFSLFIIIIFPMFRQAKMPETSQQERRTSFLTFPSAHP